MKKEQENKPPSSSPNPYSLLPTPLNIADIVISVNGRDTGKLFIVIETDNEYSLIADGKGRRLEKPKRKKNKHLEFKDKADNFIAEKLQKGEKITNNEIRRFLASHTAESRKGAEETCKEGGMQDAKR